MLDYAFFAMLFAIATSLAPSSASEVGFQNTRHPDQHMTWVRGQDGRWAMTINGREAGHYQRQGDHIIQDRGDEGVSRYAIGELLSPQDLRRGADRIRLDARFSSATLEVRRNAGTLELHEAAQRVLVTGLRLESRTSRSASRPRP